MSTKGGTMQKIERLTPEQEAKFPQYIAEWKGYGLSTEPADRPRAEAAIKWMYAQAGMQEPHIIWTQSPLGNALAFAALKQRDSVRASVWASVGDSVVASVGASARDIVGASVWDSARDSVGASVWASVVASVGASVRDSVWASVRDSVRASVWDSARDSVVASVGASVWASVRDIVGASVWASVWDSVGASVGDSVVASVYGQHDAHWLAFYRFFADECGLQDKTAALSGLWELCQSAGWALPYERVCFVSDRHDVCRLNDGGRIHCEDGPAIRYRDGFAIYAWHGTRLPAEWVESRKTIDPSEILRCENVEQRAAGAAMIGWPRMVSALKRRVIDGDPDTDFGALIELTLPGLPEPGRFLQAVCVRNGPIVEGCPRISDIDGKPIETAKAAQAWRVGLTESEYRHPESRT
jgi:hypothetical protein